MGQSSPEAQLGYMVTLESETRRKAFEQQQQDGWCNLPCAFGGGKTWEKGDVLQQRHSHLPSSCVVSFLAPESSKGQGEAVPLMAPSLLQLIVAPAIPQFIPKATAHAEMFVYYSPK